MEVRAGTFRDKWTHTYVTLEVRGEHCFAFSWSFGADYFQQCGTIRGGGVVMEYSGVGIFNEYGDIVFGTGAIWKRRWYGQGFSKAVPGRTVPAGPYSFGY